MIITLTTDEVVKQLAISHDVMDDEQTKQTVAELADIFQDLVKTECDDDYIQEFVEVLEKFGFDVLDMDEDDDSVVKLDEYNIKTE